MFAKVDCLTKHASRNYHCSSHHRYQQPILSLPYLLKGDRMGKTILHLLRGQSSVIPRMAKPFNLLRAMGTTNTYITSYLQTEVHTRCLRLPSMDIVFAIVPASHTLIEARPDQCLVNRVLEFCLPLIRQLPVVFLTRTSRCN